MLFLIGISLNFLICFPAPTQGGVVKSAELGLASNKTDLVTVSDAKSSNSGKNELAPYEELEDTARAGNSGKRKGNKQQDLMSKILPMMVIPFMVSSSLIPIMLTSLKIMLLKSMFVGKMAILLLALNALWRVNNQGAVYSHNINLDNDHKAVANEHYGYNEGEEYGAYVNRKRR